MNDEEFLASLTPGERKTLEYEDAAGIHMVNVLTAASLRAQAGEGSYQMTLKSVGNPDFRQYAAISPPVKVATDTLAEMAEVVETYIRYYELGGGNWPMPVVQEGARKVGYFSYNGRLWDGLGAAAREVALG